MSAIEVNGVQYHYLRQGSGPALILLHGFTGSSAGWVELMNTVAPLADTIAIDLLGHGRTESPASETRYAMNLAADDIVELASGLGVERFHLLGYSMGGRLALYMARRFPEKVASLILESASPGIADEADREVRKREDEALAVQIEREGIDAFVSQWEQLPLFASQSAMPNVRKASLRQQRLANNKVGLANSLRGMGTGNQPSLWPELPGMRISTLLICGSLDQKFVQIGEQMNTLLPEATLRVVPGAGHTVHIERPKEFAAAVSTFLEFQNSRKRSVQQL